MLIELREKALIHETLILKMTISTQLLILRILSLFLPRQQSQDSILKAFTYQVERHLEDLITIQFFMKRCKNNGTPNR